MVVIVHMRRKGKLFPSSFVLLQRTSTTQQPCLEQTSSPKSTSFAFRNSTLSPGLQPPRSILKAAVKMRRPSSTSTKTDRKASRIGRRYVCPFTHRGNSPDQFRRPKNCSPSAHASSLCLIQPLPRRFQAEPSSIPHIIFKSLINNNSLFPYLCL